MSQLNFYLDIEEKCNIAEFIFSLGGYLIPSLHYDKPEYIRIKDIDSYLNYAKQNSLLFVLHENYVQYPLEFDSFNKNNITKHFIKQRIGGPTIDFYSSGLISNNQIGSGFISYYPYFINDNIKINASNALIDFYKMLSSQIKRSSLPYSMKKKRYFIGKKLLEKVVNNDLTLVDISKEEIYQLVQPARVDMRN